MIPDEKLDANRPLAPEVQVTQAGDELTMTYRHSTMDLVGVVLLFVLAF